MSKLHEALKEARAFIVLNAKDPAVDPAARIIKQIDEALDRNAAISALKADMEQTLIFSGRGRP